MMDFAMVDLPEPLSPTTPNVSPRRTSKLTSDTAWTMPCAALNSTTRFSIFRSASLGGALVRGALTMCSSSGRGSGGGRGLSADGVVAGKPVPGVVDGCQRWVVDHTGF